MKFLINETQLAITEFMTFFKVHFNNDFRFNGEMHDFWECFYVIKGSARVSADDRIYELAEGDIIFHKPLEMHKFSITDTDGATLLIFSYKMQGSIAHQLENKVFSLNESQRKTISDIIEYCDKSTFPIGEKSNCLHYLISKTDQESHLQILSGYLCLLFLSLVYGGTVSDSAQSYESLLFKKAVDYMKSNLTAPLAVSDIAKQCNISESGLKRLFNKYAGMSVHRYFLNIKIKHATRLLKKGMSVTDVSNILNFSSQSYFSVAFKRETGVSPSNLCDF